MLDVLEPATQENLDVVEDNSTFTANQDPAVTQTIEYTQGSNSSPYFIPSSFCD